LISTSSGMEIPGHFRLHHIDTERRRKAMGWEWWDLLARANCH
jgi:hypothetical protein